MKPSFISHDINRKESLKLLVGVVIISLSIYFLAGAAHFFKLTREELGKYFDIKWVLLLHITGGGIALLTGPFLLWEKFRNANLKLHRFLGKVYLIAVLISGLLAVYLSLTTAYAVNWAYAFSLQVWVSVWLSASFFAYYAVINKKIKLHKEWMARSYMVSLAFVISALILKIPYVQSLGSFEEISPSMFWFGWAVPLYIYDLYLSAVRKQ
jgi:uncharacterized membrane protein